MPFGLCCAATTIRQVVETYTGYRHTIICCRLPEQTHPSRTYFVFFDRTNVEAVVRCFRSAFTIVMLLLRGRVSLKRLDNVWCHGN